MTRAQLRRIRLAACPDMTQAEYARALGYADHDAYRKYESGARPIPKLLAKVADMIERHGMPDEWTCR